MKWFKKLFPPKCLCCGEVATKDVKDIYLGEHTLHDLIITNEIIVTIDRYRKIEHKYRQHMSSYPLCTSCYYKVEIKREKSEEYNAQKKKELEINNFYEKLTLEVERKKLELGAKSLGIDLNLKE